MGCWVLGVGCWGHEIYIWNSPVNCDKCVYWLLPLCWVENVWWWHICMTRTQSQLCSHTCISHSITDNISNVSPLSSKGILYNNQLEIGKYESLPAKSLWSWWVVPDLPGPDWHPQIKRRIEIRIAVNAAQTWCANLRWRERGVSTVRSEVWWQACPGYLIKSI